jgi:hypothetical protein
MDVLREKTKGNLTVGEQQLLESLLHQLKMAFVDIANQPETVAGISARPPGEQR